MTTIDWANTGQQSYGGLNYAQSYGLNSFSPTNSLGSNSGGNFWNWPQQAAAPPTSLGGATNWNVDLMSQISGNNSWDQMTSLQNNIYNYNNTYNGGSSWNANQYATTMQPQTYNNPLQYLNIGGGSANTQPMGNAGNMWGGFDWNSLGNSVPAAPANNMASYWGTGNDTSWLNSIIGGPAWGNMAQAAAPINNSVSYVQAAVPQQQPVVVQQTTSNSTTSTSSSAPVVQAAPPSNPADAAVAQLCSFLKDGGVHITQSLLKGGIGCIESFTAQVCRNTGGDSRTAQMANTINHTLESLNPTDLANSVQKYITANHIPA